MRGPSRRPLHLPRVAAALLGAGALVASVFTTVAVAETASGGRSAELPAASGVDPSAAEVPLGERPGWPSAGATPAVVESLPAKLPSGGITPQIVGGGTSTRVPAASVALVVFVDPDTSEGFSCSGTLVAAQWILTAGHCLVKYVSGSPVRVANDPAGYQVYVGSGLSGTARSVDQVVLNDGYLARPSSEDVPGYRKSDGTWEPGADVVPNYNGTDDFGLLHLTTAPPASPVPLATDDLLSQSGRTVWAAGWGLTVGNGSSGSATLQEAAMTVANSTYCEIAWSPLEDGSGSRLPSPVSYFSAGPNTCYYGATTATCNGDSGGPVMSQDESGSWWLVATISGGAAGCPVNTPYVGVRSQFMAAWVALQTGQAQDGRVGESFNAVVPQRIMDSREGAGVTFIPPTVTDPTANAVYLPVPRLPAGFVTRRPVYGQYGVPGLPVAGVAGVVLNVTVDQPTSAGFVAVYPCADGWGGTSSVNFEIGQTVANLVVSKVDRNGDICVYAHAETAVIVDLTGWLGPQPSTTTTDSDAPTRLLDSRSNPRPAAGSTTTVQVTGSGKAPAGSRAAVLNVTSADAAAGGYVTVYPCDQARPTASNLNPVPGRDIPNAVMVKLDALGRVCLYTQGATHLVVDLNGWVTDGTPGTVKTLPPSRLLDTRSAAPGRVAAATPLRLHVAGVGRLPAAGLDSVLLNVTVTEPSGPGHVTVYPCGVLPTASNLNYRSGQTVPNAVMAKVDPATGDVCLWSVSSTHLVVDVTGFVRT